MTSSKLQLTLLLLCFFTISFSQNIKQQIGTSVWYQSGKMICDSTVSYIIDFDKKGNKTREWQIYKNEEGVTIDTNWVTIDSLGRQVIFHGNTTQYYSKYKGKQTLPSEVIMTRLHEKGRDTIVFSSTFTLDDKGRIITEEKVTARGSSTYRYVYKGNMRETYIEGKLVKIELFNDDKQWVLHKVFNIATGELQSRSMRILDEKNRPQYYLQTKEGVVTKVTIHEFNEEGIETYMEERHPLDDIIIKTTFDYTYW